MGKKAGLIIQYIIFLGGGIFLIWWQFNKMTPAEFSEFKSALANADYRVVIPIVFLALLSHLSRSLRWRIMIETMGYRPTLFNTFGVTMVGYLANTFLPRVGEILKCSLLGKYEKIPVQKLIGTIVAERVFDLACYILFGLFTFIIEYQLVGNFIKDTVSKRTTDKPEAQWMITILFTIAIIVTIVLLLRFILKKFTSSKIVLKIKNFLVGLREGITSVLRLQKKWQFLFHTVFIWSMYLLQVYIGFSAIADVSHLGFNAACAVLTLAALANIITPGGIGTFPTAIFLILSLYNISRTTGEAFGWLMWGVSTFIVLFFGLLFLGLLYFRNKKKDFDDMLPETNGIMQKEFK
jgi:uncharacterized protein (TIRG00374 family)